MGGNFTRKSLKGVHGVNMDSKKQCNLRLNFNASPSALQVNVYIAYDNVLVIKENNSIQVYH